jgi:hypothetical protein
MSKRPGFHRSDFTGSEGPGLKKLRTAKAKGPWAELPNEMVEKTATTLAVLRKMMLDGQWEAAILLAAKYQDLGDQRDAILKGREAIMRPHFQRQLKRDPAALVEAAKAALKERYG